MPAHVCRNGCALRMALTMMPLMCLCPVAHGLCSVALYCRAQSLVNPDSWAGHNGPLFCAPCALQCHASSAARPGTTLLCAPMGGAAALSYNSHFKPARIGTSVLSVVMGLGTLVVLHCTRCGRCHPVLLIYFACALMLHPGSPDPFPSCNRIFF